MVDYNCRYCAKPHHTEVAMRKHIYREHQQDVIDRNNAKPITCTDSDDDVGFSRIDTARRHALRTGHDISKQYGHRCPQCHLTFSKPIGVSRHIVAYHDRKKHDQGASKYNKWKRAHGLGVRARANARKQQPEPPVQQRPRPMSKIQLSKYHYK